MKSFDHDIDISDKSNQCNCRYAYKWFLEFALETTAAACEANGKADSDMLTQYNSVADYKGMIQAMINGDTTAISGSYADGRTAFRQYIHRLINVYNTNATAGNTAYDDFTVDFANDQAALAKFLQLYLAQQEAPALSLDKVVVAPAFENETFELDGADYQVGVNAFTTIAEAVAAVNENGVVSVLAGEYAFTESVTVNKSLQISLSLVFLFTKFTIHCDIVISDNRPMTLIMKYL